MITSPLEQFEISPFVVCFFGWWDASLTEPLFTLIFIIITSTFVLSTSIVLGPKLVPGRWQLISEKLYKGTEILVKDNLEGRSLYFPFIFTLFCFLLSSNLVGLLPFAFSLTSQLSQTLFLAFSSFFGGVIISICRHKWNFLNSFLPEGVGFWLAFFVVPLEFISFLFKPLSLGVRLFANMMAGHTLLKVMAGFGWFAIGDEGLAILKGHFPVAVLFIILFLEIGVSIIQAYVFTVLTSIYITDGINQH
uniref:ATPase subunit 6 n=1 Tax=Ishige okamurae TaxID=233772 RepID=UPI002E782B0C|nr:ATPase subunit 6 [Ishige okamurae]WBP70206.1 ATPase subunit 6 [Ishige okamurae]